MGAHVTVFDISRGSEFISYGYYFENVIHDGEVAYANQFGKDVLNTR